MAREKEQPTTEQATRGAAAKTPREWAIAKGHLIAAKPMALPPGAIGIGAGATDVQIPAYASADALHGWSVSAYHAQGESVFRLTEADYDAALLAGLAYPSVAPHAAAVTRECPFVEQHKTFKPRGFAAGAGLDGVKAALARQVKQLADARKVKPNG